MAAIPMRQLASVLVPVAAVGLALATSAGALLFSVRAQEYASLGVVQIKLGLVAAGFLAAAAANLAYGVSFADAGTGRRNLHACVSLTCWLGALVCGRLIAFVAA